MVSVKGKTGFVVCPPKFVNLVQGGRLNRGISKRCDPSDNGTIKSGKRCVIKCVDVSQPTSGERKKEGGEISTEEVFAIDAGRDLFFRGMDEAMAIEILEKDFGEIDDSEDRFIAAERLKFFPSEESARALMDFVDRFDRSKVDEYKMEERIARRKAVETLGRHKGAYLAEEVKEFLSHYFQDADEHVVENAIWAIGEIGGNLNKSLLEKVVLVLDQEKIDKRVVIQTLLRAGYKPAVEKLRTLSKSNDLGVSTAAMSAVAVLSGDVSVMEPVIEVLKSEDLNARRYAIEDIKLGGYTEAMSKVAICPNSLVLRARTIRSLLDKRKKMESGLEARLDDDTARIIDRLIWDHPGDLDLLGMKKETRRARDLTRNVKQLYKNDALYNYVACRTIAEDYRGENNEEAGLEVTKSYNDLGYFDYFGAYHVYKTLGWIGYKAGYDLLIENATELPPRFFNHKAGAITALAELGRTDALKTIADIAIDSKIWEVKYACLIASERLGDGGCLRKKLRQDSDWVLRARCANDLGFDHLRNTFPK